VSFFIEHPDEWIGVPERWPFPGMHGIEYSDADEWLTALVDELTLTHKLEPDVRARVWELLAMAAQRGQAAGTRVFVTFEAWDGPAYVVEALAQERSVLGARSLADAAGADALVVCNTLLAMAIDVETRRPTLGNLMGGLSGPSLKPIALRMSYQCANAVDIPIIGCGGISTVEDVVEFLIAGATAVQVGTATFIEAGIMERLIADLRAWMQAHGVSSVADLVGSVRDQEAGDGMLLAEGVS